MRDETALRRQWLLLKALSSRHQGLTVRMMVADTGVTEKTIRRDLELFRSLGFPLEECVGEFGRKTWQIKATGNQPPLSFCFDEALALHLGRRLLEPLAGTVFWEAAHRAFQKIRASLGQSTLDYLERFGGFFHQTVVGTSDYTNKADLIDSLMIAVEDGKASRILYQSERATEPSFRDVHPYGLLMHRGALYLIALDPQESKFKHFKVDRIEEAEVSPFPFRRPEGFDLAAHLASTFGAFQSAGEMMTIKVRFAPVVARYVLESKWPGCRQMTKQSDGSVLAEFQLSCLDEIKRWLMGFGSKALVLEPERLRQEMVAELHALLSAYSSSGSKAPALIEPSSPGHRPGR